MLNTKNDTTQYNNFILRSYYYVLVSNFSLGRSVMRVIRGKEEERV